MTKVLDATVGVVIIADERDATAKASGIPDLDAALQYSQIIAKVYNPLGKVSRISGTQAHINFELSNGKHSEGGLIVTHVELLGGYHALVVTANLADDLTTDEVIEVVALLRGSRERVRPGNATGGRAVLKLDNDTYTTAFHAVLEKAQAGDLTILPAVNLTRLDPWPEDAAKLLSDYSRDIHAIVHLWINQRDLCKANEVSETLAQDIHPFDYGVAVISPTCSTSVHPANVVDIARLEGQSLSNHHVQEWTFFCGVLMIIGFQRAMLEGIAGQLRELAASQTRYGIRHVPANLSDLGKLSRRRKDLLDGINLQHNSWLARREYMNDLLLQARHQFRVEQLQQLVDDLVQQLNDDINAKQSASLAALAGIVGILALIASIGAVIAAFAALR
jgi:hypothetical protein